MIHHLVDQARSAEDIHALTRIIALREHQLVLLDELLEFREALGDVDVRGADTALEASGTVLIASLSALAEAARSSGFAQLRGTKWSTPLIVVWR